MARATTGGRIPVGGRRRSCRRLLLTLLSLAVFAPAPVNAASDREAWLTAQQVHSTQATAVGVAVEGFSVDSDGGDLQALRARLGRAVRAMDALEVHECFRVWWSYVRTSYVMFDLALMRVEASQFDRAQSATAASVFLSALANATAVDCVGGSNPFPVDSHLRRGGGSPLVEAIDAPVG